MDPRSTRSSPADPPASVPSLSTVIAIDSERDFVVSNNLITGLGDQLNFVDVGVDVTVKAPVDAVYDSRLGLENVVVGSSGVTPSNAAIATVPEMSSRRARVPRVRDFSMVMWMSNARTHLGHSCLRIYISSDITHSPRSAVPIHPLGDTSDPRLSGLMSAD